MDAKTEALLPCPFCGNAWVEFSQPANGAAPSMRCRACNVSGPLDAARIRDRASAVEAWNTRALAAPEGKAEPVLYVSKNWQDEARRYSTVMAYPSVFPGSEWVPLFAFPPRADLEAEITPEMIAAGWACLRRAGMPHLGPGPGLIEAYRAMRAIATKRSDADGLR